MSSPRWWPGFASLIDITDRIGGVQLGLALWIGFSVVLWTGAVMWEKVPSKLAAIHPGTGDVNNPQ